MNKTYQRTWRYKQGGALYSSAEWRKLPRASKRGQAAIIRQRGDRYQVEIMRNGSRLRHSEATLEDAKTYAEIIFVENSNLDTEAIPLPHADRQDALSALAILRGEVPEARAAQMNTPLAQAAWFWKRHHPDGEGVDLNTFFNRYLENKERLNRRPRTIDDIRLRVGNFIAAFPANTDVRVVTRKDVRDWLDANTRTFSNWKKHCTLIRGFFAFAIDCELRDDNPAAGLKNMAHEVVEYSIEIYTPEEISRLLSAAVEYEQEAGNRRRAAPSVVPVLALGAFAGIRPAEIQRLLWTDVNFRTKRITVHKTTAKKRRKRSVPISDNLAAWLLPYAKESGPISPSDSYLRSVRPRLLKTAGIEKWLHDGLRHSFGSYHCEHHHRPDWTAQIMGHRDTRVMNDHYVTAVDDPEDAERYWNIRPARIATVIQFPMVAG
jgi:integrase